MEWEGFMSELRTKLSTAATLLASRGVHSLAKTSRPYFPPLWERLQTCCLGSAFLLKLQHQTGCAIFRRVKAIFDCETIKWRDWSGYYLVDSRLLYQYTTNVHFSFIPCHNAVFSNNSYVYYILDLLTIWLLADWEYCRATIVDFFFHSNLWPTR